MALQKWVGDNYLVLRQAFGERSFTREDAIRILRERKASEEADVNVVLSELRKAGLLETILDKEDARKRFYMLKDLKNAVGIENGLTRDGLEALLKQAADLIRTRVDYKFILILLFLKRISDKWELEYEHAYQEALDYGLNEREAREEAKSGAYHDFDLPDEFLWDNIRKDVNKLPERMSQALKILAERNPELKGVVDSADFIQFTMSTENSEILRQLVELFSSKKLHHVSPDILGDAYEWVLRYFAPQKAKEGEVYTPREAVKLLIEILDPKPNTSVYDPACGSGGMLITAHKYVEEKYGKKEAQKLFLFGQEANPQTYALSKMNLYIHDIRDVDIRLGDTLLYPKFADGNTLKAFDIVIANPPWNQDGFGESLKKGDFWEQRFPYGFTPRQSADWAWIQHMLASAKERVGIVIDNGCLFRGGKEKIIRQKVLENGIVECVILLPEKLFYNTGAPGAVIIFNKKKPAERKSKILFINASTEYEKHPYVRKLNTLAEKNITKIVKAYNNFKNIEGFARIVSLDEIKEKDYNQSVTLYVSQEEKQEDIDVNKEWEDLRKLEVELTEVEKKISQHLKAVG